MRDELTVVPAAPEHYEHFTRFHRELQLDDPPTPREKWLATMLADSFFLEQDGRFVAYGFGQVFGDSGYIRHVVVDREHRGRGFGRAVMREHARRFREAGRTMWRLNVLTDNETAIALYESLGMRREFETWVVRLAPALIARLPMPRDPVVARDINASEYERVEAAFGLPRGMLATTRMQPPPRLVVVEFERDARQVAFARFDPSFPGCWPLRAPESSCVRPLLEALQRDFPPNAPWIQLVVERDEHAARALLAAGATLKYEITHMSGALPAS